MRESEGYEQLIAFLESNLPAPVVRQNEGDAVRFLAGDPPEVIVELTAEAVVVSEFAGVWESEFQFTVTPRRVGVVHWPDLPETPLLTCLTALIKGARQARQARCQPCPLCGRPTAPEWLHEEGICQTCAADDGAVH